MSVDRVSCIINVCSTWLRKRFTRVFLNASIREDFHFFGLKKKNYETLGIKIDLFICILLARDLFHRTRCGRKFVQDTYTSNSDNLFFNWTLLSREIN